jgi:hypothetical protein
VTPRTAVLTLARGRHQHLLGQVAGLSRGSRAPDLHLIVAMGDPQLAGGAVPVGTDRWETLVRPLDVAGSDLPLAAARNLAARSAIDAGAQVLVFLDVDCIPGQDLVRTYADVVAAGGSDRPALWCGDVGYLPAAGPDGYPPERLDALARPAGARPVLAPGELMPEPRFELFWSLSFAVSAADFTVTGGFCTDYLGYGGEDTDFAQLVRAAGGSLTWVGGATAYHQHHDSIVPPVQHRRAVVRNANVFHDRWGWWPMQGWLDAFAAQGLAERQGADGRWVVTG